MSKAVDFITQSGSINLPLAFLAVLLVIIITVIIFRYVLKAIHKTVDNGAFLNISITVDGRSSKNGRD